MDGDDRPGDQLAAQGDEIALGYGDRIAAAVKGAFKAQEPPDGGAWLDHLIACPECHRICDHRNTIARGTWALLCEEGRAMRPDLEAA